MKNILTTIGIIVLLVALLFTLGVVNAIQYNDGICTECGGHYVFVTATPSYRGEHKIFNNYIYTCEDCGHTIQTASIMK